MALYEPLGQYLRNKGDSHVPMTFGQVEKIIGRKLPASAYRHRPWWANEERGHSHAKAWLQAGYETEKVDMAGKKLTFRRNTARGMADEARDFKAAEEKAMEKIGAHPLIGAMKGTFTIEPGYDLTSPMYSDKEWAEIEKEMEDDWDQIEQGMPGKNK